jgi:hypothetical protein
LNVVEGLINVLGREGKDAGSVQVPIAVSVDREEIGEQLMDCRLAGEPDAARELSQSACRPERLGDQWNDFPWGSTGVIHAGLPEVIRSERSVGARQI